MAIAFVKLACLPKLTAREEKQTESTCSLRSSPQLCGCVCVGADPLHHAEVGPVLDTHAADGIVELLSFDCLQIIMAPLLLFRNGGLVVLQFSQEF